MFTATYQNTALGSSWTSGTTLVSATGQAFDQAIQFNNFNVYPSSYPVIQAYAGTTITVSGWLNGAGLAGHPAGNGTWNVQIGILFQNTSGSYNRNFITQVVPAGQGWTYVTGTLVVPTTAATALPFVGIDCSATIAPYYAQAANLSYTLSFNSTPIIPVPTTATPMQMDFEQTTAVAVATSPFTMGTQMQVWPGAEQWTCNVALPSLKRPAPDVWQAFLLSLQGRLNIFQMGDYSHTAPTGTVLGNPMVDGTNVGYNLPTSYFLHTKGWTANQSAVLNAGDYIQIGVRLHRVTSTVVADNNGNAIVPIWPSIREQPGDGQDVITSNTKGLWRLADNKCTWTEHANKIVGLAFKVMEAR